MQHGLIGFELAADEQSNFLLFGEIVQLISNGVIPRKGDSACVCLCVSPITAISVIQVIVLQFQTISNIIL